MLQASTQRGESVEVEKKYKPARYRGAHVRSMQEECLVIT